MFNSAIINHNKNQLFIEKESFQQDHSSDFVGEYDPGKINSLQNFIYSPFNFSDLLLNMRLFFFFSRAK